MTTGQLEARPFQAPTVQERALAVFDAIPNEEALKAKAAESAHITTITNQAGYDQCHSLRMALKNARLEIERTGEAGREDAVQTSKAIISIQKSRISVLKPEEDRLQALQKVWDDRIAAEKEAKIKAEQERVERIQRRLEQIRSLPVHSAGLDSLMLGKALSEADSMVIDPAFFEEFTPNANEALTVTRAALTGLLAKRKEQDERERQAEADRKELELLRAAEAERRKIAEAEQAKREAEAKAERDRIAAEEKAKRDAEAARVAEENRIERERIAKEAAEAKARQAEEERRHAEEMRRQKAEADRIASERQRELDAQAAENARVAEEQRVAAAAEAGRLAAERAELERQQAALAETNKPKAARSKERPTDKAIVEALAKHYGVKYAEALNWLVTFDIKALLRVAA